MFRLLNESMAGQIGWLLGFAVVAAIALVVVTRLRRGDDRTGWLLIVGGAFAISAVAFSGADGIFHPYYVSFLAPFSAALVGAGVGIVMRGGRTARIVGPALLAGGIATSLVALDTSAADLADVAPLLLVVGGACAVHRRRGPHGAPAGGRARRRPGRVADRSGLVGGPDARSPDERDVPRRRA